MINDLHGNPPRFGFLERARDVAVERIPGFGVDLGFQGGLQGFVGVVGAEEVGVADEEAFFVVVGVDEPAGDAFGAVAADFAGVGMKDVDAVYLDLDAATVNWKDVDVGFTEDDE